MSINPRKQRHLKRKIFICISLLVVLSVFVFLFNTFNNLRKPFLISPIGKTTVSKSIIEKALREKKISYSKVLLESNFYLIDIQDNCQVRLSYDKDLNDQITSLQRILRELTIEGKPFKSIDFRFSEPIISF